MIELVKEFAWCKDYDMNCVTIKIYSNAVTVYNSYKITKYKHMKEVVKWIKEYCHLTNVTDRSTFSLISEWRAHNLLYKLGYEKSRTAHCDLNNEPWYRKLGYFVLSLLYFG